VNVFYSADSEKQVLIYPSHSRGRFFAVMGAFRYRTCPVKQVVAALLLAGMIAVCGCRSSATAENGDPHTPNSGFVTTDSGVQLHYLDFGGDGEFLVFLAGAGNSAHIFEEFAPRFTDHFRVIALTRRGFGESAKRESGYDTATLASDIRECLDALGIT